MVTRIIFVCISLILGAVPVSPSLAELYATTAFELTYSAYNPSGNQPWQLRFQIHTPTAAGSYPIAIVIGGSGVCTDPPVCSSGYGTYATIVAQDAARRGMIAAAVQYDSAYSHLCGCTGGESWTGTAFDGSRVQCGPPNDGWDDKARAIFDHGNANSALRRLIAVTAGKSAKAELRRGLVVFGHSQGSWVARLGNGYAQANGGRAVDGAVLTGTGDWTYFAADIKPNPFPVPCVRSNASGVVPASRLRAFDGRSDIFFGVNTVAYPGSPLPLGTKVSLAGVQRSLFGVTGLCSASASKCLSGGADGGGWRVVVGANLSTRTADHAFMTTSRSSAEGTIDAKWRDGYVGEPTDPPVSLKQNLNWLARKLGPPVRQAP